LYTIIFAILGLYIDIFFGFLSINFIFFFINDVWHCLLIYHCLTVSVFSYIQFIMTTNSSITICTLKESFLFDWGCLVSNSNKINNPIAKAMLVYLAMLCSTHSCSKGLSLLVFFTQSGWKVVLLPSLSLHHWWTVVTHCCCTVMKLNSADVQTVRVQTTC